MTAWIPQDFLFHLAVIGSALALLWLGIVLAERWRGFWLLKSQSPRALFRELCRAHALSRSQRQLLREISQQFPLEQCCQVFVDPQLLEDYARAQADHAEGTRKLRRLLFPG